MSGTRPFFDALHNARGGCCTYKSTRPHGTLVTVVCCSILTRGHHGPWRRSRRREHIMMYPVHASQSQLCDLRNSPNTRRPGHGAHHVNLQAQADSMQPRLMQWWVLLVLPVAQPAFCAPMHKHMCKQSSCLPTHFFV